MKPVLALVAGLAVLLPAAAGAREVAYHYAPLGGFSTYLIDWKGSDRARVVNMIGASTGSVAPHGDGRLVSLTTPITLDATGQIDRCGEQYTARSMTEQVKVRELPDRRARLVEIGRVLHIGGCDDGLSEPFGDPDDPGLEHVATPMDKRAPMDDVVPGLALAGLSEQPMEGSNLFLAADIATLQAGSLHFAASGHVYPAAIDAQQWLVVQLPGGPRAYTRLSVDAKTGGETWLLAERAGGKPQRVIEAVVVRTAAGADFGSVAQASRKWEWGLFKGTETEGATWLYRDGTGERITYDQGGEVRVPIEAWWLDGLNLVQLRDQSGLRRERFWVPLRNEGKHHWVMESEWWTWDGQEPELAIGPRVALFTDLGKAVKPPFAQRGGSSPPSR